LESVAAEREMARFGWRARHTVRRKKRGGRGYVNERSSRVAFFSPMHKKRRVVGYAAADGFDFGGRVHILAPEQ